MKSYTNDFTRGAIFPQLIKFALPLVLSNVLQLCYNIVDMSIVGQVEGQVGLSAVSVGGDVVGFLTFVSIGFASAAQVLIAQFIGANRRKEASRFVGTAFAFLMLCAAVISIICFFLRKDMLRWMRTPDGAFTQALSYSTICIAGLIFIYGYNMVSGILRGLGDSRHPLMFVALATVLNVGLDLWFVIGLGMGAGGAALATVISQAISFLSCGWFILRNRQRFQLELRIHDFLHLDKKMLLSFIRLGIPMALKTASVHFSKLLVNALLNSYGIASSAFAGIASKITSMGNSAASAIAAAGASMVGQNIGAENYPRVPQIIKVIAAVTLTLAAALSAMLVIFPEFVFGLFTGDLEVIQIGIEVYLPCGVATIFACGFRSPLNALLNGSGISQINFVTAVLDAIIMRIGLVLLLGIVLDMGQFGFWMGDALAGYTPFFIGIALYASGIWKRKKAID